MKVSRISERCKWPFWPIYLNHDFISFVERTINWNTNKFFHQFQETIWTFNHPFDKFQHCFNFFFTCSIWKLCKNWNGILRIETKQNEAKKKKPIFVSTSYWKFRSLEIYLKGILISIQITANDQLQKNVCAKANVWYIHTIGSYVYWLIAGNQFK